MKVFYQTRDESYCARVTINNTYPSHMHKQIELIYVTKGRIEVTIDDYSQILSQGDLSICFPNQSHNTKSIGDSSCILIIFNPEFTNGFITELTKKIPAMPFLAKSNLNLETTLAIKNVMDCYARKKDPRIASGYLSVILGNLLPLLNLKNITSVNDSTDSCKLIIDYIANNFMNEISLDSIAHELGLSKYYISHIFSERIKTSFPVYLNKCRAEHAATLLKTTTMSVTDIGYASGFNSSRTFYRAFKQIYNLTPHEYRNN